MGEIITDVEDADTGWCKGSLNGKIGMFPDNFVKVNYVYNFLNLPIVYQLTYLSVLKTYCVVY